MVTKYSIQKYGSFDFILIVLLGVFFTTYSSNVAIFSNEFYSHALFNILSFAFTWLIGKQIINHAPVSTNIKKLIIIRVFIGVIVFFILEMICHTLKGVIFYHLRLSDIFHNYCGWRCFSNYVTYVLMLTIIYEGMYYFEKWTMLSLYSRSLEKENIRSKFETLKSQVSPDFINQSLSTLITYIEKDDKKKATEFTYDLSDYFRYSLSHRDVELSLIEEEIEIVKKYINLNQPDYNQDIILHLEIIPEVLHDYCVPSHTLLLLTENAIKHNQFNLNKPLNITISATDTEKITVINNLNPTTVQPTSKSGLRNIKKWYHLILEDEIDVIESSEEFAVILPLIKYRDYESNNH